MKMLRRIALAALFAWMAATPGLARERILLFVSDVQVQRNSDLIVTETIRVQAEQYEIKRGILRDFPTVYSRRDGSRVQVAFEVQSVTRDGVAEDYTTERISNGTRVRIGSADRMLTWGPHEYVIKYRTTRQIGFFPDFDELYWNATGTGWTFAIDVAEARITLPEQARFGQSSFYTGPQGAKEQDAAIVEQRPGYIVFRTTRPSPAHSGLTVASAFAKGIVIEPTQAENVGAWLSDNIPIVISVIGLALMLLYYGIAWLMVGRDPNRGTIIPLFGPPDGMSAPAVRYVRQMGFDDRTYAVGILDLAVHGHIKLIEDNKTMRVEHRTGGQAVEPALRAAELKLFERGSASVTLTDTNYSVIGDAKKALEKGLADAYADKLFKSNKSWAVRGIVFSVIISAIAVMSVFAAWGTGQGAAMLFGMVFLAPAMIGLAVAGYLGLPTSLKGWMAYFFGAVFVTMFALGGAGAMAGAARSTIEIVPGLLPFILLSIGARAFIWVRAHTPEGRKITDQIEGFRQYLSVAEESRLEYLNPPQQTQELFERFLPYAVALDVENSWAKRFAGVLAAAAAAHAAQTSWYQGNHDWSRDPVSFADHLGSGLSQTVSSASTPPGSSGGSSSSGSSGGGSSGGGGGGGGGSGW